MDSMKAANAVCLTTGPLPTGATGFINALDHPYRQHQRLRAEVACAHWSVTQSDTRHLAFKRLLLSMDWRVAMQQRGDVGCRAPCIQVALLYERPSLMQPSPSPRHFTSLISQPSTPLPRALIASTDGRATMACARTGLYDQIGAHATFAPLVHRCCLARG